MANQEARYDPNAKPALIAHSKVDGQAETRQVVATNGELWSNLSHWSVLIDKSAAGTTYIGNATPGSNAGSAVWSIIKVTTGGTLESILFADGDTEMDNVWNNRGTLSYS